jgi:hypothetical protein
MKKTRSRKSRDIVPLIKQVDACQIRCGRVGGGGVGGDWGGAMIVSFLINSFNNPFGVFLYSEGMSRVVMKKKKHVNLNALHDLC